MAMGHVEQSGTNWELIRECIDPEIAQRAGEQALQVTTLISSPDASDVPQWGLSYDYQPPGQEGIEIFGVKAWSKTAFPNHPATIFTDERSCSEIPDLLLAFQRAKSFTSPSATRFNLHVFGPDGHTRTHRDRFIQDTLALGVLGTAKAEVTDPTTKARHEFEIHPGDALYFLNPRPQRFRPLHRVTNISAGKRISLVV